MFPSNRVVTWRPASLHRVPAGGFPGFLGTIRVLRLPAAPPAALRCLRLAVPRERSGFRSHRRRAPRRRAWGWSPGSPVRDVFRGDGRISHVRGEPLLCLCPALRPRQDRRVWPCRQTVDGRRAGNSPASM